MREVALRQGSTGDPGLIAAVVAPELDTVTIQFNDNTSETVNLADKHYFVRFFDERTIVDLRGTGEGGYYADCRPRDEPAGDGSTALSLGCYRFGRRSGG